MADDKPREEEPRDPEARRESPRIRDIARRLFPGDPDAPLRSDMRDAVAAVLNTGDKAKTEMVRMVAREVRNYLQELKIGEDLKELVTNHSLELHASVSLKPIADRKATSVKTPKKKKPSAG